jgi:hypothetical protein
MDSNVFITNKYTRYYHLIVDKILSENRSKGGEIYYEKHHITPRSLGGNDDKLNLVLVTPREHFILHWLLTKMCINTFYKMKMINSFSGMFNWKDRRNLSSRQYQIIRNSVGTRKQSPESNKKRSEKLKGRKSTRKGMTWEDFYGHEVAQKMKEDISKTRKGVKKKSYSRTIGTTSKKCTDGILQFNSIKDMAKHYNTSPYLIQKRIKNQEEGFRFVS